MTSSEKEKIIEEGFDAIRKVYNLRGDLLEDAGNLEAARESNRKLSDRVANLEVTIKALNSAIDKKDVEIKRLNNRLNSRDDAMLTTIEVLEADRNAIYDVYLKLAHKSDADEEIKRHMIADNRKKKEEIKSLREELEAEKKFDCCDRCVCGVKKEYELLRKAHTKLCCDYNTLCENRAKLEDNFHELREKFSKLYLLYIGGMLELKDVASFSDWFIDTFGDFGKYDEEE